MTLSQTWSYVPRVSSSPSFNFRLCVEDVGSRELEPAAVWGLGRPPGRAGPSRRRGGRSQALCAECSRSPGHFWGITGCLSGARMSRPTRRCCASRSAVLGTCRDIKVTVSLALCDPGRAGTILESLKWRWVHCGLKAGTRVPPWAGGCVVSPPRQTWLPFSLRLPPCGFSWLRLYRDPDGADLAVAVKMTTGPVSTTLEAEAVSEGFLHAQPRTPSAQPASPSCVPPPGQALSVFAWASPWRSEFD